ncbi:hypothetical protein LCGC14_0467390 [marine sediment metagenome]|uniref:Uncharacterized protein n=1 Tax=marine sediment metagenome TaxID=412755 RepID=A0A0F9V064_9ZZZZ
MNTNQMEDEDMTKTNEDKFIKKVGMIISKLMDLRALGADSATVQHIIDSVNDLEGDTIRS